MAVLFGYILRQDPAAEDHVVGIHHLILAVAGDELQDGCLA